MEDFGDFRRDRREHLVQGSYFTDEEGGPEEGPGLEPRFPDPTTN